MISKKKAMTMIWPAKEPKNIIIRMPNWLGDLVMATPLLHDLRRRYPKARLTAMCQSNVATLLRYDPHIDEILSFTRPSGWLHNEQHHNIIDPLRNGDFDLGILTTNSFSSAWWFWRGRVRNRLGYAANLRSFLLDKAMSFPQEVDSQHLVITYKMLLAPLGIPVSDTPLQLYVTEGEIKHAHGLLRKFGCEVGKHTIVGINPGAAFGSAKCWLPERFEEVTRRLLEDPSLYVVYFGDILGAPLVNSICKDMPDRVINLAGKTSIRELMGLISCCSVILSNDSGPMHIAAALQVPLVALFGSTSAVKTSPYQHGTVLHKHVSCSPCYKRICPTDFRCMKQIGVDEVYKEILATLNQNKLRVIMQPL